MKTLKRLLIINYDFPPAGGAGIKRGLKFMKYLPEYGWQMIVLTVRNGNHSMIDASLLKEIKAEVRIYRTYTFESIFLKTRVQKTNNVQTPGLLNDGSSMSIKRLLREIYDNYGQFFQFPDSRILWIPAAILNSLKLIMRKQFDVIYATGPTFVNFIVAALLKILSKKPLIIDFRDAWVSDPMLVSNTKKYQLKAHTILENFTVKHADKVITTNPFVTRDFQQRYSYLDQNKFVTIYNGYDIDDFSIINEPKHVKEDKFTIVYTGRLYAERTPKYFLEALKLATDEEPSMRDDARVIFVGSCEEFLDGNRIEDYIKKNNIENVVQLTGHISRKASLEYQVRASVLLMIIGIVPPQMELTYGLSGKIFDYILSGKPILTLANGGATREFIVDNKIGEIYFHEDLIGIKNYLITSYNKFKCATLKENYDLKFYENFDFRNLTKSLATHLNDVIMNKA